MLLTPRDLQASHGQKPCLSVYNLGADGGSAPVAVDRFTEKAHKQVLLTWERLIE